MSLKIKLYTDEFIVHRQTASIEELLERTVIFEITLHKTGVRSNIQFEVNETEMQKIKYDLGYNVLVYENKHWLPYL